MPLFGKPSKPTLTLSTAERTILDGMADGVYRSALTITIFGFSPEEAADLLFSLLAKKLIVSDEADQFSSKYDLGPKFQITSAGRKAIRS